MHAFVSSLLLMYGKGGGTTGKYKQTQTAFDDQLPYQTDNEKPTNTSFSSICPVNRGSEHVL